MCFFAQLYEVRMRQRLARCCQDKTTCAEIPTTIANADIVRLKLLEQKFWPR